MVKTTEVYNYSRWLYTGDYVGARIANRTLGWIHRQHVSYASYAIP